MKQLMKKIVSVFCIGTLLLSASCNKEIDGLPQNSWSVSGKTFSAVTVTVIPFSNYLSAADAQGSTLDLAFKQLPTISSDFMVSDVAHSTNEVSVRTVIGGSIVYNTVKGTGGLVSVGVTNGKYRVIMNNIKLVNEAAPKDTVVISSNIMQQ